jgi:hypothetical protein
MNLGTITYTNSKGQLVIPKQYRDKLNITPHTPIQIKLFNLSLTIKPVVGITTSSSLTDNNNIIEVLKYTQGAWASDNWSKYDQLEKTRHKVELKAAQKMKKIW